MSVNKSFVNVVFVNTDSEESRTILWIFGTALSIYHLNLL